MKQRNWKRAFIILAAANLALLVLLFVLTRPAKPAETEKYKPKTGTIQIVMNDDALEAAVTRGLRRAGIDGSVAVKDGVQLTVPVEAYGFRTDLALSTEPAADPDGRMRLSVREAKLGDLPLPPAETVAVAGRLFHKEGVDFDGADGAILIDPAGWASDEIRDLRAVEMDPNAGRYIFQGMLGE